MTFSNAITSLPKDILKFSGTAPRSEFIWKLLILIGANIAYFFIFALLAKSSAYIRLGVDQELKVLIVVALIPLLAWPAYMIPLQVRRLKDTGVSGWWYLAVVVLTFVLGFTWVLAWLGGLINLAFFVYLVFMPTAQTKGHKAALAT